jgi:hypothetical protein
MKILSKINDARQIIKKSDLKKAGRNEFSKYDYYTPEQVNKLVNDACQQVQLFNKFDLLRTELGLVAELSIYDLDSNETTIPMVKFSIATEIPEIKATNVAQQLGGAVTYSERYLLMIAYDIKDNNLDFDSQKPKEEKAEKPWLDSKAYQKVVDAMNQQKPTMVGSLTFNTNEEILNYIEGKYRLKNEYKNALKELLTFNQKHES